MPDGTPQSDYRDVVMAILECAVIDRMDFVFAHIQDALQDPPYPLCLNEGWRVVEFDDG